MFPSKRIFQKQNQLPTIHTYYVKQDDHQFTGINFKQLSLVVLVIQNSLLVLLMRCSRTNILPDKPIYIASTAVFMAEIVKIIACLGMLYYTEPDHWLDRLRLQIMQRPKDVACMLIPSSLYALQNNLLYIALSNLEAATFQVTYQLKIMSTAVFSVWLLRRSLNQNQWAALVLLMVGVTLVQSESMTTPSSGLDDQQPWVGLLAVLASCISSGFAGCYFEKMLKSSVTSMWIRSIQLGICGTLFSFLTMLLSDYQAIRVHGMLHGYDLLTWCVVLNQAIGGLLVALVVKYADNILKGFATSISILLSSIISFFLLDFKLSYLFMTGAAIVIMATVLYGK